MDIHKVDMNPMSLKVIGREACSWAKGLLGLSKTLDPRGIQTFEGERKKE
jgi:hypothetical protein